MCQIFGIRAAWLITLSSRNGQNERAILLLHRVQQAEQRVRDRRRYFVYFTAVVGVAICK